VGVVKMNNIKRWKEEMFYTPIGIRWEILCRAGQADEVIRLKKELEDAEYENQKNVFERRISELLASGQARLTGKLRHGEIVGFGYEDGGDHSSTKVFSPAPTPFWKFLNLDFEKGTATGLGITYSGLRFVFRDQLPTPSQLEELLRREAEENDVRGVTENTPDDSIPFFEIFTKEKVDRFKRQRFKKFREEIEKNSVDLIKKENQPTEDMEKSKIQIKDVRPILQERIKKGELRPHWGIRGGSTSESQELEKIALERYPRKKKLNSRRIEDGLRHIGSPECARVQMVFDEFERRVSVAEQLDDLDSEVAALKKYINNSDSWITAKPFKKLEEDYKKYFSQLPKLSEEAIKNYIKTKFNTEYFRRDSILNTVKLFNAQNDGKVEIKKNIGMAIKCVDDKLKKENYELVSLNGKKVANYILKILN